jgi:hypothetical protein
MSRQVILTIASAIVLSAVIPGFTGYTSAQLDAIERKRVELLALHAQLDVPEVTVQPMAAGPCAVAVRKRATPEKRPAIRVPRHHRVRARRHFPVRATPEPSAAQPRTAPGPPIR